MLGCTAPRCGGPPGPAASSKIAEAAQLARRRRAVLAAVLVGTGGLAVLVLGSWVFAGALIGGGLLPVDSPLAEYWTLSTSSWLAVGDGHPLVAQPFGIVLAGLTALLGGFWGTPTTAVITVLMAGGIPLAALGAWFAAGAATRSLGIRAWVAASWALVPPMLLATGQGRIGSLVAHIMLPWVALGVVRSLGVQRRDVVLSGMVGAKRRHHTPDDQNEEWQSSTPSRAAGSIGAAAAAGLALALASAAAPVLLVLATAVVLVLLLTLPRRKSGRSAGRWRLLLVLLPGYVFLGPWLLGPLRTVGTSIDALSESGRLLLSEPGVPVDYAAASGWQVLLGWPSQPQSIAGLDGMLGILVPLLVGGAVLGGAVVSLVRGGTRARGVRIAWLVAIVGLVAALALPLVPVGLSSDGTAASSWPGPAVSLMLLGLLVAAALGGDGVGRKLGEGTFGWRQGSAAVLAALLTVGPVAAAVTFGWLARTEEGTLMVQPRGNDPVPALGRQVEQSAADGRVLSIVPTADGYDVQLWRSNGPQLIDGNLTPLRLSGDLLSPEVTPPDEAASALAVTIARLSVSTQDAAAELTTHAVAAVVIPPADSIARAGADPAAAEALAAQLDATAGLERVTTNASGTVWRVVEDGGVARARVLGLDLQPSDTVVATSRDLPIGALASDVIGAAGELQPAEADRLLVLSERADPAWSAELGGVRLEPVELDWRQAFAIPAGASGEVNVTYADSARTLWLILQVVVLGLTALIALPTRRNRPGEVA